MELQNTSPNLTSRESVQRKIANALDYLRENYNIVDKSVREGDATTMDIARSFTGDVKSDKLSENIGLLDFSPFGTYFAAEEGQDAINKAEPNAFKRQMALLNYLRQPLQTIIDRPDIGLPATDIALGGIEAIPFGYVVTKPIKGFFKSLKAKATEPSKDVGMITQQTSLPTSGDVSTTTVPVKNEEINQSRRNFIKDTGTVGTVGALGLLGTQVPDAIKMVEKAIELTNKFNAGIGDASLLFYKYNLYKELGDTKNALLNYELHNELKDTLEKLSAGQEIVKIQYNQEYEIKKQLDSLKHLDEIRLQQAETRAKEEEIKAQKKVETALFIGIFLVIGFLGFVYKQLNTTKKQKVVIEEKQQEISDSINYAKRIQDAMMTSSVYLKDTLPKSFIFFKPKDVVSRYLTKAWLKTMELKKILLFGFHKP